MLRIAISFLLVFFSAVLPAAEELSQEDAHKWLQRMSEALHTLNYDGVFVYQYGDQLTSMRLIHGLNKQGEHERLVSLGGSTREVIRSKGKVTCILPDKQSVVVESEGQQPGFPYLLPRQVQQISSSYRFELGQRTRVSGLMSQQIRILPLDNYRYSHELWIDIDSGMLIKAEVRDSQRVVEQFMFTTLRFMPNFPQDLLRLNQGNGDFLAYHHQRPDGKEVQNTNIANWKTGFLPSGFKLQNHQYQFQLQQRSINLKPAANRTPVHHLVYSDGLATISVFIEQLQAHQSALAGAAPLGALNSYARVIDHTQITVVGDVPELTVRAIAESVQFQP